MCDIRPFSKTRQYIYIDHILDFRKMDGLRLMIDGNQHFETMIEENNPPGLIDQNELNANQIHSLQRLVLIYI